GWDKVLVMDDGFGRDSDTRRRWLYTALTRAKKEVLLVVR
ncbi:MAG: ATP-binding domain-containing protein, partial [Clostridia bacterium]|nr:ATP-binding domain-containing protein [Clostridia bacterium]